MELTRNHYAQSDNKFNPMKEQVKWSRVGHVIDKGTYFMRIWKGGVELDTGGEYRSHLG